MDAFYASVELLRYPQLRGLPVVIGGRSVRPPPSTDADPSRFVTLKDYAGRGVATTATYEARALGVNSGASLMRAKVLAPNAILLPADFEQYGHYSRLFKAAVADIAPRIEDRGIDEIYIDLTEVEGETVPLAQRLKHAVRQATGLSCSIGVTPNKLLSKIASELDKPDGLTVLTHEDLDSRIWPLPVKRIHGVGPRSNEKLQSLGINTIGQLAATPLVTLVDHFGTALGQWLHTAAHGEDERPVVTEREPKSLSRETTFERDLDPVRDRKLLSGLLLELCEQLSADLERKGFVARTIGVRLRFEDFRTLTRELTWHEPVSDAGTIRQAARSCIKRVQLDRRLRLLGVRAGGLLRAEELAEAGLKSQPSLPLFDVSG